MSLKRDDLEQLGGACARRAGIVLASLLDFRLVFAVPWLEVTEARTLSMRLSDQPSIAVLAELEGAVLGRMGLLVSEPGASKAAVRLVSPRPSEPPRPEKRRRHLLADSALLEMGNLAFSAAANALAEAVGGRVFPSVPRFSTTPGTELAEATAEQGDALIARFDLVGPEDSLQVRLVWLPDPTSFE
jgi:chemotaxis protein CheY-P-specific phosphatase CheC